MRKGSNQLRDRIDTMLQIPPAVSLVGTPHNKKDWKDETMSYWHSS